MVKLGIVQTISYSSNQQALKNISPIIKSLGRSETDIVTLPEQWLQNNRISDFDEEFDIFKPLHETIP
jgi:hypothetical protein